MVAKDLRSQNALGAGVCGTHAVLRDRRTARGGTWLQRGGHTYFFRCGCNSGSLQIESNAAQDTLMGRNVHGRLLSAGQVHKLHMARVGAREGQEGVVAIGAQDTEA